MIKSRLRKSEKKNDSIKPDDIEYFLKMRDKKENLIYVGWYIPSELLKLKECIITRPALMVRLISDSKAFNTIEKCITAKKYSAITYKERSERMKKATQLKNKSYLINDLTHTLNSLWPSKIQNK